MLKDSDRKILRILQPDPSQALSAVATQAGMTTAACARRLEQLRAKGVLRATQAVIDWVVLGYAVEVSLRVTLDKIQPKAFDEFIAAARDIPEVTEIQTFLGRVDVRLSIIARDMAHYQWLYRERVLILPHISDIEALMQVSAVMDREVLPL